MKALSIQQPWAFAIVRLGKDIENRTWSTKYRGPVLIHAGKNQDSSGWQCMMEAGVFGPEQRAQMERYYANERWNLGGIIGVADIVGCVSRHPSPWFSGPYGFVLANAGPVPFVPLRGMLGLFDVDIKALGVKL